MICSGCRVHVLALRGVMVLALLGASVLGLASCTSPRRSRIEATRFRSPHDLLRRSSTRLRSASLDIKVRYHQGGDRRFPFALINFRNRTDAPIYPQLEKIILRRRGQPDHHLRPACDRDHEAVARLAPQDAHWCSDLVNPGHSVDLPVALFEIPPPKGSLRFELIVPVVFNRGDPVPIRFLNEVGRKKWRIAPPEPTPAAPSGSSRQWIDDSSGSRSDDAGIRPGRL
ncbi:MAG: hypothetical protein V3U98_09205 [Acidobacteriota bacterium]